MAHKASLQLSFSSGAGLYEGSDLPVTIASAVKRHGGCRRHDRWSGLEEEGSGRQLLSDVTLASRTYGTSGQSHGP